MRGEGVSWDDQYTGTPLKVQEEVAYYLVEEAQAEYRSEYYDHGMHCMAGGSPAHSLIIANIIGSLHSLLRGSSCNVYDGNLRVYVAEEGAVFYPDATVICGEPEIIEGHPHAILNPSYIVEVLSESTATFDKGRKFLSYQKIPSLQTYIVVHQKLQRVEVYQKSDEGWTQSELWEPEAVVPLPMDIQGPLLADIYQGLSLESLPGLSQGPQ